MVIKAKISYAHEADVKTLHASQVQPPRNKIDNEGKPTISGTYASSISWSNTSSLHSGPQPLGIITLDDIVQQFLTKLAHSDRYEHEDETLHSGSSMHVTDNASANSISAISDSSTLYPLSPTNSAFSSSGRRSRFPSLNRRRVGVYRRSATYVHDIEIPKTDTARPGLRGLFDSAFRRIDSHLKWRRGEGLPLHHLQTGAGTSTLEAPSSLWETTNESLELTSPATNAIYERGAARVNGSKNEDA